MELPLSTKPANRLEIIDMLRGFALFGLFSVHLQEHFELFVFPEKTSGFLDSLDKWVNEAVYFLFAGKAYALFAFLFGLSFFIQMDSQAKKGVDFTGRFFWRLIVLGILGWFHSLIYSGDILTFFFIMGMALLFVYKAPSWLLWGLAAFFLLQTPFLVDLLYRIIINDDRPNTAIEEMNKIFASNAPVFSKGSFGEVVAFNTTWAQLSKWMYMFLFGRVYQTLGLFMLGILIGRSGFFSDIGKYLKTCRTIWFASIVFFVPLFIFNRFYLGDIKAPKAIMESWSIILSSYANFVFVVFLFCGFILINQYEGVRKRLDVLKFTGRMSLTNYVTQSLICVPIFYGYGLGLYDVLGFTYSFLLGVAVFTVLLFFSKWWMGRYHYGPLEWIWRAVTYMSFKGVPLKKSLI